MTKATPQELEALAQEPTSADGAIARSALSAPPQDVVEGIVSLLKENIRIQVYGDDATAQIRDDNLTLCATAILASGLVTAAADNGDLNVADSPLYSKALNALRTAHEACFRSADRDVLGMSKGPFSGVNLALGIIKNLEEENTLLKATVLRAESAIRADERERCAQAALGAVAMIPMGQVDASEFLDVIEDAIAAAIRAGGAK